MFKCSVRLEEERDRVKRYLNERLLTPTIETVENALIVQKIDKFIEEFQKLLVGDNIDKLAVLYKLVIRVDKAIVQLCQFFKDHIIKDGKEAVEKIADKASDDPILFVETIWSVYDKYRNLLEKALQSDAQFFKSLDAASMDFVNINKVTEASPIMSKKTPELLAKYCDVLLKNKAKQMEINELETKLTQAVTIFRFITDKDVYNNFYLRLMTQRLLQDTSASADAELLVISKLKEACGVEYTSKLQRVFHDVQLSEELNKQFTSAVRLDIDLSVKVISGAAAPWGTVNYDFSLPQELASGVQSYTAFYITKHQGRKLTWAYPRSRGDVIYRCSGKVYTFNTSVFQMAIMLLFNSTDQLRIQDIVDSTDIKIEILVQIMKIFLKTKLFTSATHEDSLIDESVIKLNTQYRNKKLRININMPI
ncbi:unnamed protein product, partial [Oppiella nova]